MLDFTESVRVDADGNQEHRGHWEVFQRQNYRRIRQRGLGRGADRPENPTAERAPGSHRGNGESFKEDVNLICLNVYRKLQIL